MYPLIIAATADGVHRGVALLRCSILDAAGAPRQASLFVSNGSLFNTRAVALDLHRVLL